MTDDLSLEPALPGRWAYLTGTGVVFLAYAAVVLLEVSRPVAEALGRYRGGLVEGLGLLVALGLVVALLCWFLSLFVFASAHNVEVLLRSSAAMEFEGARLLAGRGYEGVGATLSLTPELLFPRGLGLLVYLLPPVLLAYAGYRTHAGGGLGGTVGRLVGSYAVVGGFFTVGAGLLFNLFGGFVLSLLSPAAAGATLGVEVPDKPRAMLVGGVAYPLVFGSVGAVAAEVTRRPREAP
jgi:hypothetical protein